MQDFLPHDGWKDWIDNDWIGSLGDAPFLVRCAEGRITWSEMRAFLVQHHYYAQNFTRYLCSLIGNLPDQVDRRALMENLFEEMGLAEDHPVSHARLYVEMLAGLGIRPEERRILLSTRRLVDSMQAACRSKDILVGLGALCLGAEAIVPFLYSRIMVGMGSLGVHPDRLEYFRIHIQCDDGHALTMKHILDRETRDDPVRRARAREAGRRLIEARTGFFAGIAKVEESESLGVSA